MPRLKTMEDPDVAARKEKFVEYYTDVPVVRYAAQYCGRDEDTAHRWMKEDTEFAERVQAAESAFIKKKMKQVKGEFALERLFKQIFSQRIENTGKDGAPLQILSAPEDIQKGVEAWLKANPDKHDWVRSLLV